MKSGKGCRAITVHDICRRAVREQQPSRRRCFPENLTHYGQSNYAVAGYRRQRLTKHSPHTNMGVHSARPLYIRKEDHFLKRL